MPMIAIVPQHLEVALQAAAVIQLAVALANFRLVHLLGWRDDLARMPRLMREVFLVHLWFISLTLAIFGVLTIRFAHAMVRHEHAVAVWLASAIAIFWLVRAVIQVTFYSSEHWRGKPGPTAVHVTLLAGYALMGVAYALAALGVAVQ